MFLIKSPIDTTTDPYTNNGCTFNNSCGSSGSGSGSGS